MDINNVQKANLMIKELTKHGRVDSFSSAVGQAQKLYGELPSNEDSSEISASGAIQTEEPVLNLDEQKLNSMLRDKLGTVLSAYNDGVMGEIDKLRAEIFSLKNELQTITPQQVQQQIIQSAPIPQETVQEAVHAPAPTATPKQGGYTSADVSVEKMFYFGNN